MTSLKASSVGLYQFTEAGNPAVFMRSDIRSCWDARCDAARYGTARVALKDYLVIYEQAEDGAWGSHSPDVEGVFALGQTREEVETRMAGALAAHLEHLRESDRPIPDPHTHAGRVAA